ncbi:MAG: hypothetical protein VXW25_09685, partial [Pseudomonadota bacterium]|nr:hypothetical protein [Pseudomonadota bacterium]
MLTQQKDDLWRDVSWAAREARAAKEQMERENEEVKKLYGGGQYVPLSNRHRYLSRGGGSGDGSDPSQRPSSYFTELIGRLEAQHNVHLEQIAELQHMHEARRRAASTNSAWNGGGGGGGGGGGAHRHHNSNGLGSSGGGHVLDAYGQLRAVPPSEVGEIIL